MKVSDCFSVFSSLPAFFALLIGFGVTEAFAIDQVKLNDGQIIEGTVLTDIPNRYLDIRLINGQTRRIQKSDVESVERDLPSETADRAVLGNESRGFGSVLIGGASNMSAGNAQNMNFNFGLKFGWNVTKMDFAWLSLGLGYDYVSNMNANNQFPFNPFQIPDHDIHFDALLTRVGQSGFYFGPSAGFAIFQNSMNSMMGNAMQSSVAFGGLAGYQVSLSKTLVLGPDVRFEYIPDRTLSLIRYGLQLGMSF
jgi:hypothetical protein